MTAAAGSGCGQGTEGVAAEFLFVLCKEDSARLIKYTGYGNAAGLLLSHGLLGKYPSNCILATIYILNILYNTCAYVTRVNFCDYL